jgi:hypothetical protein
VQLSLKLLFKNNKNCRYDTQRKRVLREESFHYYEKVTQRNKNLTVHHFAAEGKNKNVVYKITKRCEESNDANHKKLKGRPVAKSTI